MLQAALQGGCDAVYFGVKELNMRATATNFELSELSSIAAHCHDNGIKAYLTINVLVYEQERSKITTLVQSASDAEIDAIICWDPAVIRECKRAGMPFFISTQASVSNISAAQWYHEQGAEQIILARECSLEDIRRTKKELPELKIEVFAHGAMCVAVSGRCFMSQFLYGKSANRGDCIQPCRRSYQITDPETGKELELENNYVMSAKDLCTLDILDDIVTSGVDSLKIEGRAKTPEYVKTVVSAYRNALDHIAEGTYTQAVKDTLFGEVKTVFNRDFTTGFYLGAPGPDGFYDLYGPRHATKKRYVGKVRNMFKRAEAAEIKLESEDLSIGDTIMIQGPTTGVLTQVVTSLEYNNRPVEHAEKGSHIGIKVDSEIRPNDKVFVLERAS